MEFKVLLIFIKTVLYVITMPFQCVSKLCPTENAPIKSFNGSCRAEPGENMCLVCPVKMSVSHIVWSRNGEAVYRGDFQVRSGKYKLNVCHDILESLEVENVGLGQHQDEFICSYNVVQNVLSRFVIEIEAQNTLHIQEIKNGSFGTNAFLTEPSETLLKCVLEKGYGNITLTWLINRNSNGVLEQVHYYEDKLNGTYISVARYNNNGCSENVTCTSDGSYIKNKTVWWLSKACGTDLPLVKDTKQSPQIVIIVVAVLAVFGVVVALYSFKRRPNKYFSTSLNEKTESSHVSEDQVVQSKDPLVVYSQVAGKRRNTKDLCENNIHVILEEQVKSTSNFDYWRGTWRKNQQGEQKCFVKTLNEESSLWNAFEFNQLVGSLGALQAHANVVNILSTITEEVPYAIYYEYMAFGTLRDVLTSQYQQTIVKTSASSGDIDIRSQTEELVSFAYDIAEAMIYITTNNFSHPALSASKTLLTGNGRCKLYDIYPMQMAICKIDDVMKKTFPPVAWLAPETIFLKEYSCSSDMWNFAVVLWEIFSIGDIPCKGMTQDQVEQNIKQSIPLSQPLFCPGALYSMMLSCWVTARTERPTFEYIRSQLLNVSKP